MHGLEGICATVMTDSHYVSSEAMQAYGPLLEMNLLELNRNKVREVLKETNTRKNSIFS
jgi:hypothetical protein